MASDWFDGVCQKFKQFELDFFKTFRYVRVCMKKAFVKATPKDINHTSFAGYLQVSYQGLLDSFSFPNDCAREDEWRSGDGKVRVEWAFKTKGKKPTVITIYDYKDPRPLEDIDMWHVGLKGDQEQLEAFFREQSLFVMTPTFNTDCSN